MGGGRSGGAGYHPADSSQRKLRNSSENPVPASGFGRNGTGYYSAQNRQSQFTAEDAILNSLHTQGMMGEPITNKKLVTYQVDETKYPELYDFLIQKIRELNFMSQPKKIAQISIVWSAHKILIFVRKGG